MTSVITRKTLVMRKSAWVVNSNPLTALVPVVMLTSSSERSDMEACYRSGANGFVRKPVDFGEFTEKLNRLQAYWLGVNESIAAG